MRLPYWAPSDIFYTAVNVRIDKIKGGGLFGGSAYSINYEKDYTKLGLIMAKVPGVITLPFLIAYYLVAYPLWFVYEFLGVVLELLTEPVFKQD